MSSDPPVTRGELDPIHGDRQAAYLETRARDYGRWRVDDYIFDILIRVANRPRLLVTATIVVLVGSGLVYSRLESDKGPIEGIWWAIVTGFTVGYGDQYPVTTAGRGVGAFLIVSMFVLALCLGAQITSRLIEDADEFTHEEQEQMKAMLRHDAEERDQMLALLTELSNRLTHGSPAQAACPSCGHVAAQSPGTTATAAVPVNARIHDAAAPAAPTHDAAAPAAPTERPSQ